MPHGMYENLPKKIFGLKPCQHRAFKMRDVLVHYDIRVGMKTTKLDMLKSLVRVEKDVSDRERKRIGLWFSGYWCHRGTFKEALYREPPNSDNLDEFESAEDSRCDDEAVLTAKTSEFRSTLECSVCMDELGAESFPKDKLTAGCEHEPTVCHSFLTRSVESQIDDKPWDQIGCPECLETLSFETVKRAASVTFFER